MNSNFAIFLLTVLRGGNSVPPPTAPSGLTATVISTSRIDLAWTDNADNETEQRIYRSTDGVSYSLIDTIAADLETYSDTTITAGVYYRYKVGAANVGGEALSDAAESVITALDQLPGLVAWYDASDLTTQLQASGGAAVTANNDPVGYVADKSGNGYHISQATAGNKFTLKTNVLGGESVWQLDGADFLSAANVPLSTFTVFLVFRASTGYLVYEHGANVNTNDGFYLNATVNATLATKRGGAAGYSQWNLTAGWGHDNTWRIAEHFMNGTHLTHGLTLNGVDQTLTPQGGGGASDPGSSTLTANLYIGARSDGTIGITGQLAEIAFFSPYLSVANRARVRQYLNTKWGGGFLA